MKQLFLAGKDGGVSLAEVPAPTIAPGRLLIRTEASVISLGTERSMIEHEGKSLFAQARERPHKVRAVLDRALNEGVSSAVKTVRTRRERQRPIGYSSVGLVVGIGEDVAGYTLGQRVISNGPHAEIVSVPANLCAAVPDGVAPDHAAFTVLGSIALQGIRLLAPTLGECVVVTGAGLIGLLTVQLLRAHGCRVLAIEPSDERRELAEHLGARTVDPGQADDVTVAAANFSRGLGVDGVVVTAATDESGPVRQAAQICRKRGRIVLVGVTGLELDRAEFFAKELQFQVSCSYGPGRYDPSYEEAGHDYPVGYVRWTEQRNFEAVLDMMADGRLDPTSLISHRFAFERADEAYAVVRAGEPALGILLDYPAMAMAKPEVVNLSPSVVIGPTRAPAGGQPVLGVIGAGGHATQVLLPALKSAGVRFKTVAAQSGVSAATTGRRFGFAEATTDPEQVLADSEIDTVVIATRHDSHAALASAALARGKAVFVEKPLAISREGLAQVTAAYAAAARGDSPPFAIGFNRRYAPQLRKIKNLLDSIDEPKTVLVTVNAGALPVDHWLLDPLVGGGRILGEGCHFVDLVMHLVSRPVTGVKATPLAGGSVSDSQGMSFTLAFDDGSSGSVHYLTTGHAAVPKERIEVYCAGRILRLDDFRELHSHGWPGFRGDSRRRRDKGGAACITAFIDAVRGRGGEVIPFAEIVASTEATLAVVDATLS